jgi:hypothetical protein
MAVSYASQRRLIGFSSLFWSQRVAQYSRLRLRIEVYSNRGYRCQPVTYRAEVVTGKGTAVGGVASDSDVKLRSALAYFFGAAAY